MVLKLLLVSVVLVGLVFMAFGIRLLFGKNERVRITSCKASTDDDISCGCGTGACVLPEGE